MGMEVVLYRFSPVQLVHLPQFSSNHATVLVHLDYPSLSRGKKRQRLFRFEECWKKDDRCEDMVRKAWARENLQCIEKLGALKVLDREVEEYRIESIRKGRLKQSLKMQNCGQALPRTQGNTRSSKGNMLIYFQQKRPFGDNAARQFG